MVALNDTIKRIVLSIVLLGGAVLSVCRSAFASNVNVNVEICGNASTEPLINLNYVNGDTVFYNPIVMNFRGDWLYDLTIERNNDIILGTTTLSFGSGQVFSQTIDLTSGVNNLKLKYNGGCPRRTVEQNLVLNYQPYGASVNLVTTSNNSPELTGRIAVSDHKINITINGRTYPAINNGDGTWRLPAGTIAPLASGEYDLTISAADRAGNITTKKLTFVVRAVNEIGFVLPPHTGYIRINRVNIPSWLIYLLIFGLVWLLSRLKCGFRKAESERTSL